MLVGFFFLRFVLKRTVENLFMIQLSRCYVKKKTIYTLNQKKQLEF